MIDIKVDTKEIERITTLLSDIPNGMEKATSNAINRTMQTSRTAAVRKVRETYDIRAKDIRSTITIKRAGGSGLTGSMISRGSTIPLIKFRVSPNKPSPKRRKPIIASVKKSGGTLKGAFVPQLSSGYAGVFTRVGLSRLPIKELYGPSAPQMIGEKSVIEEVENKAEETMIQRMSHEAVRLLGRY